MGFYCGNLAVGSTGNRSFTGIGFQPAYLRFTISAKSGVSEITVAHISVGCADGTRQKAHSILADTTANYSKAYSDRCINHYAKVSGTLTEVIKATFVSFDSDGFTLNFTAVDANYDILVEAFS